MSLIKAENWDLVTAPSIPSGWVVQAGGFSSPATDTTGSAFSSPNVIQSGTGPGQGNTATWTTQDGNSGNVSIVMLGQFPSSLVGVSFAVLARGSVSSLDYGSSSFYEFVLAGSPGTFKINAVVSGSSTNLFSLSVTGLATGVWYAIAAGLNGTSIVVSVQRKSDGFILDMTSGLFSSSGVGKSLTDGTISGQGYAGIGLFGGTIGGRNAWVDDWTLSTFGDIIPNLNQYIPAARVIHEAEKEPGRVLGAIGKIVPPASQFAKARSFVSFAEAPPTHPGSVMICGSRTLANMPTSRPLASFTQAEPPKPHPGSVWSDIGGVPAAAQVAMPRAQHAASAEPPPSFPGAALVSVNRRVELALGKRSFPPVVSSEAPRPAPGSVTYHVNPHHDRRFRRTWVARGEDAPRYAGNVFWAAVGGPAHVNRYVLPKIIVSAELPQLQPGAVIVDSGPLVSIARFNNPPNALVARAEPPPPGSGSATWDVSPLASIGRVHAKKTFIYRGEDAPAFQGKVIAPRPPLATPLLSSRVFVVQAEPPRAEPGRSATSVPPGQPPRTGTVPIVARAESPPPWAGQAIVDTGQPVAIARFNAPPEALIAWAEPPRPEAGRWFANMPPQPFVPFIIYVDPRQATLAPMDNDFTEVDPRKARLGPEYPT